MDKLTNDRTNEPTDRRTNERTNNQVENAKHFADNKEHRNYMLLIKIRPFACDFTYFFICFTAIIQMKLGARKCLIKIL